ncbi:MAG: response regulator transcription factor [Ruminococcaceae bacterium]|nr:response regulator transcription factor [Oscillospiraceae bacterium]
MQDTVKILVVDDDQNINELIRMYLAKEGYEVIQAFDGEQGLELFQSKAPSLVVLDLMLPKIDGLAVCREIRKISDIPVIMLTAKGETFDKVLGLELGADDYMVKPFETKELIARIKAVLRRSGNHEKQGDKMEIVYPGLSVNLTNYELKVNGVSLEVPPKELEVLYFLCSHPNQVFTRDQLLNQVWGYDYFGADRTVDVHIKRIREKLGESSYWQLKTVYGVGYKFEVKR